MDVSYGSEYDAQVKLLANSTGVLDTGTTLLMLESDAFEAYLKKIGAKMDPDTGFLKLPKS